MAKKKMSAEERREFKKGKYTGGPAEERAEKKGKRMALGGPVGYGGNRTNDPAGPGGYGGTGNSAVSGGIRGGGQGVGGPAGGVRTGTTTGTSATNMPQTGMARGRGRPTAPPVQPPVSMRPKRPATPAVEPPIAGYNPPAVSDDMLPGYQQPGMSITGPGWRGPTGYWQKNPTDYPQGGGVGMGSPPTRRGGGGLKAGGRVKGKTFAKGGIVNSKKSGKRMAMGGLGSSGGGAAPVMGRKVAQKDNLPRVGLGRKKPPVTNYPGVERPMMPAVMTPGGGAPSTGITPVNDKFLRPGTPKTPAVMRGGGLAKKGVGMALAKGGLAKGAGCASRGVKKPRYM